MPLIIQNFILFQIGWFSCVLSGATPGYSWIGVVVVAIIVTLHLLRANDISRDASLVIAAMILGTLWDSSLVQAGLFTFPHSTAINGLAPYWIIAMWGLFATTLNVSMKWMKGKYLLASAFGAVGGSMAYYAGHQLGAVEFSDTRSALVAVAAGWAIIMPALRAISERLNGSRSVQNNNYEVNAA